MTNRLLLPALLSLAASPLFAQEALPSATLPALPPMSSLLQGAKPAGVLSPQETPPLTEAELMRQLDALGKGDPITKLPRNMDPAKAGEDKKSNGNTEITAREGSFDQKAHLAIFRKDVFVENPDFTVNCDKLTAYLHHDEKEEAEPAGKGDPKKTGGKAAATPRPAGRPGATPGSGKAPKISSDSSGNATSEDRTAAVGSAPKPAGGGGLEKAIAEGSVVINQDKIEVDGTVSRNVGRSKKAVYEAATGNITLTGMPSVDQGLNTCVALEEKTVITLNRAGEMHVDGLHKNVIRDAGSADTKTPNAR